MTDLLDQPSCWSIRAEFEVEPLLDQYLGTYPGGDLRQYQIVYRDTDESTGDILYVMLFFPNRSHAPKMTTFEQFLDAHCKLHDKLAAVRQCGFPQPYDSSYQGGRVLGNLEGRKKAK